jgi:NAD(P)-dependent dehydrogenase (short-subunit alcohol dehydrogenase family)
VTARTYTEIRKTTDQITQAGGLAHAVVCDVSREMHCNYLVKETINHFKKIDVIVNNAGVIRPIATIADGIPTDWTENILINLVGPYYLTHFALPYLRESAGRIINVSSGSATSVDEGWSAYATAKAGLNHFTRILAAEEPSITAVSFRPGKMDTEMQATIRAEGKNGMSKDRYEQFVRHFEHGDLATPEQVGRALAVLALHAPNTWSGEFVGVNDEKVRALIATCF